MAMKISFSLYCLCTEEVFVLNPSQIFFPANMGCALLCKIYLDLKWCHILRFLALDH